MSRALGFAGLVAGMVVLAGCGGKGGGDAKATLRDMSSGEEREIDPAKVAETLSSP